MNPAILNYLQAQQGQPQGEGQSSPMQQNQGQQAPYNPFDSGIRSAIESAKQSLGMTEKQQDKALRRSMLTFADNMAQQPKQRGFFNNFGSATKALSPAIQAHDQAEDEALTQNNAMANQILAYKGAEEAKQAKAQDQAWRQQHAESQLGEQRRYHDMMNSYQQQKLKGEQEKGISQFGSQFTPIENKAEVTAYAKDKKALGSTMHELNELEEKYKKFREDYKGNLIDPMSPIASIANPAKDFFGKFANNKKLRRETADRKSLNSMINKFVVSSERTLKGGGVMGPRLIEMFKQQEIYPDLAKDTTEDFDSKLKDLKKEIENSYKASNLSLQYGVRLDPSNVEEFQNYLNPQQAATAPMQEDMNNGLVIMQDADGTRYEIPANEANDALNDGLIPVE
jgi:hypothetical protein